MKKEINQAELIKFNHLAKIFTVFMIISLIAFLPIVVFLKSGGIVTWIILYAVTLIYAFQVEKLKKNHDLHTYREIVAFSEGKHLDEIQKQREIGKRAYQTVLKVMIGAAIGIVVAAAAILIIERHS